MTEHRSPSSRSKAKRFGAAALSVALAFFVTWLGGCAALRPGTLYPGQSGDVISAMIAPPPGKGTVFGNTFLTNASETDSLRLEGVDIFAADGVELVGAYVAHDNDRETNGLTFRLVKRSQNGERDGPSWRVPS